MIHDINTGVQSSNIEKCDHIINMHLKGRWKIFTSLLTLKPPEGDWLLISPYSFTLESSVRVVRIENDWQIVYTSVLLLISSIPSWLVYT